MSPILGVSLFASLYPVSHPSFSYYPALLSVSNFVSHRLCDSLKCLTLCVSLSLSLYRTLSFTLSSTLCLAFSWVSLYPVSLLVSHFFISLYFCVTVFSRCAPQATGDRVSSPGRAGAHLRPPPHVHAHAGPLVAAGVCTALLHAVVSTHTHTRTHTQSHMYVVQRAGAAQ